jgi:nicotinate dehydrogenase subunit A
MMMQAVALLGTSLHLSETQIRQGMNGHLCRCGTHLRIIAAIKRAAVTMAA